ncbi:MAG: STAS domain-containing protein [Burkholderiales bacterium]
MAKEESGGLLSKMVKFVRNPGTSWSDGDVQDSGQESLLNKQMLKEMIERKKRNDFVRKREFDMLRKLRRNEAMAGQDAAARPSFFQSSMPSKPDDRAVTLKKIDEIEAQMSMQWWKTKHGDSSVQSQPFQPSVNPSSASAKPGVPFGATPLSRPSAAAAQQAARPVPPIETATRAAVPTSPPARLTQTPPAPPRPDLPPLNFDVAVPSGKTSATENLPTAPTPLEPVVPAPRVPVPARPLMGHLTGANDGQSSGFSASKLFAIEVDETVHDPELEEAAIRFANGDDASVEAGLLDVLGPKSPRANHLETWMTLFDFYRATGQQNQFDSAAIDFAGRFGRSAPMWFSVPEAVAQMAPAPQSDAAQHVIDWNSPSSIGIQSVAVLNTAVARVTGAVKLNWAKLMSIDDAALEPLCRAFASWSKQPMQLRFMSVENLERVLSAATPSGDATVNAQWWHLRLEVMRVMHRPDEFELVALDYCITYEVSPPSWDGARCEYKPLDAEGGYIAGHTIIGNAQHDSHTSSMGIGDTQSPDFDSQMANISTVELSGQIRGDAAEVLQSLEDKLMGADIMVISCARLIRVDFAAVGSLLNWVSARQAEGRQVQFNHVNRLVAAFFKVIGINEHAKVVHRSD